MSGDVISHPVPADRVGALPVVETNVRDASILPSEMSYAIVSPFFVAFVRDELTL